MFPSLRRKKTFGNSERISLSLPGKHGNVGVTAKDNQRLVEGVTWVIKRFVGLSGFLIKIFIKSVTILRCSIRSKTFGVLQWVMTK